MTRSNEIQDLLQKELSPHYLEVINESHGHNVPSGSETHFKVIVVSDLFIDCSKVKRHRHVYGVLAGPLGGGVHALSIHAYTPDEWSAREQKVPLSPPCLGGSKKADRK